MRRIISNILIISIVLLLQSCNSGDVFLGSYVELVKFEEEYNLKVIDFENNLEISKSGKQFIIKTPNLTESMTYENDNLLSTNSKAFFDENSILHINYNGFSASYIKKELADEYKEQHLKTTKFKEYLDIEILYNLLDDDVVIPTDSMRMFGEDSRYLEEYKNDNPFYPTITTGDFNGDGVFPDIAFIIYSRDKILVSEGMIDGTAYAKTLAVLNAKEKDLYPLKKWSDYECEWLYTMEKQKLDSHWEEENLKLNGDGIGTFCPEKGGGLYYWDGDNYEYYHTSD